jgi:predicted membrane protein
MIKANKILAIVTFGVFALLAFVLYSYAHEKPQYKKTEVPKEEERRVQLSQVRVNVGSQEEVNRAVGDIKYIRDPRTNLCFAHYSLFSGDVLATVPCGAIPPELLTVAKWAH